jgi:hypothetical protein
MYPRYITTINIRSLSPGNVKWGSIPMDVLLRGLCEQQIDDMLDETLSEEYSSLFEELEISEESRSCFLMGYIAGRSRSRLNSSSLAMYGRPLEGGEIDLFAEIIGRRKEGILDRVLNQEIEKYAKMESVVVEPQDTIITKYEEDLDEEEVEEIPLKTVATIGNLEEEKKKFSFKTSGRKKANPTILGIPVKA